jgi:hypothetical protein
MNRRIKSISDDPQPAHHRGDEHVVLRLVKKPGNPDVGSSREGKRQEPAVLVAVLSLGAIAVIILVSLLIKLLGF